MTLSVKPYRTTSWCAALVLAACALVAPPAAAQQRNNDYYASAGTKLLYDVEKFHLGVGEQKIRERRYNAAYEDFKFILSYYPNHPQALALMAQTCELWKSPACETDDLFAQGIARRPDMPGVYIVYGVHLIRTKRYAPAIENLKRAIQIDPRSVNAHYNIALAYLDTKQYALANAHAQKAYALGAPLPGLRDRLQREGQWKPEAAAAGEPDRRTAGTPPPAVQ